MTGYPLELMTPSKGSVVTKGRGRSLSMSSIMSKNVEEKYRIRSNPAKCLKRSQSLRMLKTDRPLWQTRIASARSDDNIHRSASVDAMLGEVHDKTTEINDDKQPTSVTRTNKNAQDKSKVQDFSERKRSIPIPTIVVHDDEEGNTYSPRNKTACEGIQEESDDDKDTDREVETMQCTPPNTPTSGDIGNVDDEHVSTMNCSVHANATNSRLEEESSCDVAKDSNTPEPNLQQACTSTAATGHTATASTSPLKHPNAVPPSGFTQFTPTPGLPSSSLQQTGFQFPPGCVIIMNNCNGVQFGNYNTINTTQTTQNHEHDLRDKLDVLNQEFARMFVDLGDPAKDQQMVNGLQGEDKLKEHVNDLKAFGIKLMNAKQGCVLLDFELSKDPEERLRFLKSCQSGEFQTFIQERLLSRYVDDPTKVTMILCFSIASITDTGCEHMAFNFNMLQGESEVATPGGLEGLKQYVNMSGLKLVDHSEASQSDLPSVIHDILEPEKRDVFQLQLEKAQNTCGEGVAFGSQSAVPVLADVLQRPVRLITALDNSIVDVLTFPSQPLVSTSPVVPLVIGAYDTDHFVRIDYVMPACHMANKAPQNVVSPSVTASGNERQVEHDDNVTMDDLPRWEKTGRGHALRLKTSINDPTRQTSLPDKTDLRWDSLTAVTFTDCTVQLRESDGTPTLEIRTQSMAKDLTTLASALGLFPQRHKVSKLCLGGNMLRQIPDGIALLPNLTYLSAPKNKLKKIPASIPDLTNLTIIDLNRNHLTKFPDLLQFVPLLRKVFLCFNKIRSIPANILPNMKNLELLAIDKNYLKSVPQDIVKCDSLVELHIRGNPLSSLPRMVFSIPNLGLLGVDRSVWEGFLKHNDDQRYRSSFKVCCERCQHMSYDRRQEFGEATHNVCQEAEGKEWVQLEESLKERKDEEEHVKQGHLLDHELEDQPILPSEEMSLSAHVSSMDAYNSTYRSSIEDPSEFWREISEEFHWEFAPNGKFLEHNFDPRVGDVFVRWMSGATTNITYNLLEKNIRENGRGSTVALQWQGDNGEETNAVTYGELKSLVCRAANMLKAKGIKRGHRVMVYMPQSIEQVVAMLACARIGAVHCVVYGGATPEYLADRVKDSQCTAIITADFARKDGGRQGMKTEVDRALKICDGDHFVQSCIVVRRVGDHDSDLRTQGDKNDVPWCEGRDYWWQKEMGRVSDECEPAWMDAEDPLLILYTSGSTGSPKGVIHTVGGYMMYVATTFKYVFDCGNVPNRVHFCTADLGWVTGQSYVIYGPLLNGVTTVLLEGDPLKANRIVSMVRKYKITSLYTTPTAIRHMKATSEADVRYNLDTLRVIGTVGEPIAESTWRWYRSAIGGDRCSVVDTYWQTETGGHVMTPLPGATPMKPGSATLPFFGVEPAVLTDDGKEMEGPCEGHLVFKSPWPGMMRGIHGKPEKFNSYFQQFPGYYYTGDRCRRDRDGYYRILGRREDRVSIPGAMGQVFNQLDVEATLLQHPDVKEVAVVTTDPSDDRSECGAGGYNNWYIFVTLRQTACLTETVFNSLREMLEKTLHIFTPPSHMHCARELPRTWSDKVIRRLLRKVVLNDLDLGDFHVVANLKSLPTLFRQCRDMQNSCRSKLDLFTKAKIMPS